MFASPVFILFQVINTFSSVGRVGYTYTIKVSKNHNRNLRKNSFVLSLMSNHSSFKHCFLYATKCGVEPLRQRTLAYRFTALATVHVYRSWFRHYATSWMVAGASPAWGGLFSNWSNPSNRTMTLGLTQRLTEMSTRNLPGGKKRPARRADNLAAIGEPNVWKYGSFTLSQP
jgi:hypothetical protein